VHCHTAHPPRHGDHEVGSVTRQWIGDSCAVADTEGPLLDRFPAPDLLQTIGVNHPPTHAVGSDPDEVTRVRQ